MEEYYIFTFGSNQGLEGCAVKIKGNYEEARNKMFDYFGDKWAFQYSEAQWKELENDPNRRWPMERIIKVIE